MRKLIMLLCFFMLNTTVYAAPDISAKCACLMVQETGEIIYEYNGTAETSMASTTKIMTALLALERCSMTEEATVSANAARQEGSSAYLGAGDRIPMEELLYGLMLNSGNDAAVVIAEHVSGTTKGFAELMTARARELGALNTSFKNPNGLDEEGHYTTANDLAKIASVAMKNEKFREIVATSVHKTDYSAGTLYFTNHNKLLKNYEGCIGIKTGFTKKTGRCLVSAAKRSGITLVCVTIDAPDDWNDHKKLLDLGFEKTKTEELVKEGQLLKEIAAPGGKMIPVIAGGSVSIPVSGRQKKTDIILHTIDEIDSSINKGDKLGECEIIYDGLKLKEVDLLAGEAYERRYTVFDKIKSFFTCCKEFRF